MRLLAISGSLRAQSANTALLQRMAVIAPATVRVDVWQGIAAVPAFNPDEGDMPPPSAVAFRQAVATVDGVVICSPEYAHGVAGALKNALDWLVGSGELYAKPVLLINASTRATIAQTALAETLRTMGAAIIDDVRVSVPPDGLVNSSTDAALARVVNTLTNAISNGSASEG